jgi:hypothetical protein
MLRVRIYLPEHLAEDPEETEWVFPVLPANEMNEEAALGRQELRLVEAMCV